MNDDHPFKSDKDCLIQNLRNQVDELAKENVRLERINRNKRYQKIKKFCIWLILLVLSGTASVGIVYGSYIEFQKNINLEKRCSKLCEKVIGHVFVTTHETLREGCGELHSSCVCRILSGREVILGTVTEKELNSDLSKLANKFDFKSWRECINMVDKLPDISCGKIPKIDDIKEW
jgi:hypothetical protein